MKRPPLITILQVILLVYTLWLLWRLAQQVVLEIGLVMPFFFALLLLGFLVHILYLRTKNVLFLRNTAMIFAGTYFLLTTFSLIDYILELSNLKHSLKPFEAVPSVTGLASLLALFVVAILSLVIYIISSKETRDVKLDTTLLIFLLSSTRITYFIVLIVAILLLILFYAAHFYFPYPSPLPALQ